MVLVAVASLLVCLAFLPPEVTVGTAVTVPSKRVRSVAPPTVGASAVLSTLKKSSMVSPTKKLTLDLFLPPVVIIVTEPSPAFLAKSLSIVTLPLTKEIMSRFSQGLSSSCLYNLYPPPSMVPRSPYLLV